MGAAASALDSDDAGKVTKDLKERYEKLKEEKLSDEEIQQKLTAEYSKLVEEVSSKQHRSDEKRRNSKGNVGDNVVKRKGSRDNSEEKEIKRRNSKDNDDNRSVRTITNRSVTSPTPLKQASSRGDLTSKASARLAAKGSAKMDKSAPTRRKSFDINQANKKPAPGPPPVDTNLKTTSTDSVGSKSPMRSNNNNNNNPPLAGNPSDPALIASAAADVVDSWDSVSQQPYCKICQMAFKSEAFLERHVKFSDLHIQNVKKANGELEAAKLPPPEETKPILTKQVEGEHYKLLYTGSKFFWRTQDTFDLHFYLHMLPNCLEIISYDTVKSKETNRIYMDYDRLLEIIKKNPNFIWEEGDEEARRTAITTFLLQRLQLSSNVVPEGMSTAGISGNMLVFTKLTGDEFNPDPASPYHERTPVLDKAPLVLIPINIPRRRRTNAEEIDATINSLTNDRAALIAATNRAEKVAQLVYAGATAIASKKWYSDFNPVRKRWIWAIRRVIRQKHVAVMTQLLRELEIKKEQEKVGKRSEKRNSIELGSRSKEI